MAWQCLSVGATQVATNPGNALVGATEVATTPSRITIHARTKAVHFKKYAPILCETNEGKKSNLL
jgi:hypothetical protein